MRYFTSRDKKKPKMSGNNNGMVKIKLKLKETLKRNLQFSGMLCCVTSQKMKDLIYTAAET